MNGLFSICFLLKYRRLCDIIYNILDGKSLSAVIDKGITAFDIHDLVCEYVDATKSKSPFFSMKSYVTLFGWGEIQEMLLPNLQKIAVYVMAYPFEEECVELYKRYVTSQIDLQSGISRLHK